MHRDVVCAWCIGYDEDSGISFWVLPSHGHKKRVYHDLSTVDQWHDFDIDGHDDDFTSYDNAKLCVCGGVFDLMLRPYPCVSCTCVVFHQ
jgi:hypothetical protein